MAEGTRTTSSPGNLDPSVLLYDPYRYTSILMLNSMPGWIEISWPKQRTINEIEIYTGDTNGSAAPSTECVPLDYQLQFKKNGQWVDIIPPVTNAMRYTEWLKPGQRIDDFKYQHKFSPVQTSAVRLYITRSSDSGLRVSSPDKVVIPPDKRNTMIRRIDIFEAQTGISGKGK